MEEVDDDRTVVEWEGFIAEVVGDDLFCRMCDIDPDHHDEDHMTITKERFLERLRESQPDRVDDARDFPLGLIFYLKVDGVAETVTITLPPPWTAEEIEEAKRRGEEMAEKMKGLWE